MNGIEKNSKYKHIVFICDDNYITPTAVAIRSLCDHIKRIEENTYVIHILTWGLNEKSIESLHKSANGMADVVIVQINKEKYSHYLDRINQNSHVTPIALLKFEIANYVDADTALYLDSDIVFNNDISEIFSIDITGNILASSFELLHYIDKLYLENERSVSEFYFNSGVMLLNLKVIREERLDSKLWEEKIRVFNLHKKGNAMDQDTLNKVFENRVVPLPIKYNCNCHFTKNIDIAIINLVYGTNYLNLREMNSDLIIIHYVGKKEKPWLYSNGAFCELWDKYYIMLGQDLNNLKREKVNKNIMYYFKIFREHMKKGNIVTTIRYLSFKIKGYLVN